MLSYDFNLNFLKKILGYNLYMTIPERAKKMVAKYTNTTYERSLQEMENKKHMSDVRF